MHDHVYMIIHMYVDTRVCLCTCVNVCVRVCVCVGVLLLQALWTSVDPHAQRATMSNKETCQSHASPSEYHACRNRQLLTQASQPKASARSTT